jgi:hypothetical protein
MATCSIEGKKNKYNKLMQYTGTNRIFPTLVSFQYSHYERYIVMVKHSPELIEYQKDHVIYVVVNPGHGLGQAHKCCGVKPDKRIPTLPLFYSSISSGKI